MSSVKTPARSIAMVSFFEQNTALQFAEGNAIPDVHGKVVGAGTEGHQVIAAPYNAFGFIAGRHAAGALGLNTY